MRVVHDPDGDRRALATDVDVADSFAEQTRGMMGRSDIPPEYALVFEFGDPGFFYRLLDTLPRRIIHMLFVRMPLDVLWLREEEVVKTKTLRPWVGLGVAKADTIVELPAGAAAEVEVGDTVVVERDGDGDEGESDGGRGSAQAAIDEATDDPPAEPEAEAETR
jgi:uncharacterized membrane protein (UPF0127 family)